jgi:hypothetical protein
MALCGTAILTLEVRGIALFARLHVIEKLQVDVGATTLQFGEGVGIHFLLEIRSPLEPFESSHRFIDSLVHEV